VSHEIVRHRIASFSQESTRYVNYSSGKFGGQITFIVPPMTDEDLIIWKNAMQAAESYYMQLTKSGVLPQIARSVLPNSLKTEIVVTANLRGWRTIFKQRTSKAAHPQMRELICPLLTELQEIVPVVFDDITY
jgi:thymidylate synthase (FAD)